MSQQLATTPFALLNSSADRLRTVIVNFQTMTEEEICQSLILTHREMYQALIFYTLESRPHIPHL